MPAKVSYRSFSRPQIDINSLSNVLHLSNMGSTEFQPSAFGFLSLQLKIQTGNHSSIISASR